MSNRFNPENTLFLVDGSAYLYRAFHAIPSLSNSLREPTGAIYGVANMLRNLKSEYQPHYAAVIFDAKGKNFRHDMYPDYKANRPPMPTELVLQIEPVHQVVRALGFPLIMESGVEADDVIGTLTKQAEAAGMQVVIFTGDKDMAQLVSPNAYMYDPMKALLLDEAEVENKFGVSPSLIIDYLTLMGDTADNVPGVNKVGPKTAVKWLKAYGSLDAVIENATDIKGKVGENLREALPRLALSKALVTIKCDVPLAQQPQDLYCHPADSEQLHLLFQHFEFKTWLAEESNGASTGNELTNQAEKPRTNYVEILDQATFDTWLDKLNAAETFAFDTETNSLNYMQAEIVGVSFAITVGEAAYIPLAHDYLGAPPQLDRDTVLNALKPLLEDPKKAKIGQHLKYDTHVLGHYGIHLQGHTHDTMLQSYVFNSIATRHNMDALALKYLQTQTIHFADIAGKGKKQLTFNQIALEQASPYAAEDADITLRLHHHLWIKLQTEAKLKRIYTDIEIPLAPILQKMEHIGVLIDANLLNQHSSELALQLKDLKAQAHTLAGGEFNLSSPKQLQVILFEQLELPIISKTPKGQPSTAESVLQTLALDYELPRIIMAHRSLSKLKSTYTDKLPKQIDSNTGRVHTSYHQAVAATGRLSSSDPNLQNIPIRTAEGRRIRQAFIVPKGYKMLAADYSQIELRIMAHLSQDAGLLKAFASGQDVHRATAAEVFGVTLEEVSTAQRRSAKAINFGLIYGMSAFGLGKQLKIERSVAQKYIDLYFERYTGVKSYMETTRLVAREQGYVETLFGRRLYLPDINASNKQRSQAAERTAINAPMQGTAADIIKRAMLDVAKWLKQAKTTTRLIMQVHDELIFEVPETELNDISAEVCCLMEGAAALDVPLLVEAGSGNNWDEAH